MIDRVLSVVLGLLLVAAVGAVPAQALPGDDDPDRPTLRYDDRPSLQSQVWHWHVPQRLSARQVEDEPLTPSGGIRPGAAFVLGGDFDFGVRGEIYVPLPIELSGDVSEYLQRIEVGGDVEFYIPDDFFGGTFRYFLLNVNVRSIVYTLDPVFVYALAGVNYTRITFDYDNFDNTSDNNVGINGGAGVEFPLEIGDVFAELKLTLGGATQWVTAAGIRFSLGG